MTKEQRVRLADEVTWLLCEKWGDEFNGNDAVRIYDFCMDEATINDAIVTAAEYELKYG